MPPSTVTRGSHAGDVPLVHGAAVSWDGPAYFLYAIFRFHRSRNPKADYHGVQSKASAHLEFTVVLIEAVLLLGFALPLWGKRVNGDQFPEGGDAVRIHAVGQQFLWNFHYPGPDGVFGRQELRLVSGNNSTRSGSK